MKPVELILDQMRRSFDGDAWHGPAVGEIVQGLAAKQAAAKPIPHAHSVWELVLHMTTWSKVVVRRLEGEPYEPPDRENYPPVSEVSEAAWKQAVESLLAAHQAALSAVENLPETRLRDTVPGKKYDIEHMLHGLVQHDLYHAGQIALLKKAF